MITCALASAANETARLSRTDRSLAPSCGNTSLPRSTAAAGRNVAVPAGNVSAAFPRCLRFPILVGPVSKVFVSPPAPSGAPASRKPNSSAEASCQTPDVRTGPLAVYPSGQWLPLPSPSLPNRRAPSALPRPCAKTSSGVRPKRGPSRTPPKLKPSPKAPPDDHPLRPLDPPHVA